MVVDDHGVMRQGLALLLSDEPDFEVVAQAADGVDAIAKAEQYRPEVILMDVTMPGMNGIEAMVAIRARLDPAPAVIMLSMHNTAEVVSRARRAGATGYLLKEAPSGEMFAAIRAGSRGWPYVSEGVAKAETPDALQALSIRERRVLQLVAEGHTAARIGTLLCVSPKSVETYRRRLQAKLGIRHLPGLVHFALKHGLIGH